MKILEIDEERRRLSLSLKRVEGQVLERREVPPTEGAEMGEVPDLGLSEEVFASEDEGAPAAEEQVAQLTPEAQAVEAVEAAEAAEAVEASQAPAEEPAAVEEEPSAPEAAPAEAAEETAPEDQA